ncbi:hypothetical protein P3X46_004816 [Hevea brasiliensis]|uniref:DUF4408 domain-containing protein n=1 Tax=Hevea brasiliensis TaxID=3981 RepID=A0ABQ9N1S5_HEVBR|nr:uncharacterized protein LOC110634503 [Hevea brasiliensis]KAJ9185155.1 hypothetical protein P3X46_004816 [Hevea brasiliensis]
MDQTGHQKLPEVGQIVYYKYHLLRRNLQVLLTMSLVFFSLCFFLGFSLFPNSFYVCFNTCLLSFLTHKLERKYVFLICNGILAVLAKSSVSCRSSTSGFDFDGQLSAVKPTVADIASIEDVALSAKEEEEEEEGAAHKHELQEQEGENLQKREREDLIAEDEGNDEERGGSLVKRNLEDDKKEEGGGGGNEELASTEELNRRFEEFIRKMKEEIRIEAQQQLIAV